VTSPAVRAGTVAFIASFCTLVIELVAGRVLAPYVGVSLYTWTSIIGVVLAGISAGAWAGGWLADRRPAPSTLGWLLIAAGLLSILIAPATGYLAADDGMLTRLGIATTLLQRVVVLSFVLFFLPSFFLGMISPVAVKLAVRELDTAGRVVGRIYAVSTLGSIAGTFVTGFYLVARFGTRTTLVGVGVVLIATALVFGGLFGRVGRAAALAILAGGAAYAGLWPASPSLPPDQRLVYESRALGVIHTEESQYYTIQVERTVRGDTGALLHALQLDHLTHSYSDLDDPSYLEYGYMRIFEDIVARGGSRYLFIGGGGYTLPRYIHDTYPHARVDVVEIDPAVTRVARRYFAAPRGPRIRTINEDARWFSMRDGHGPYDAIFIDAFNDLSVPYHLTTREQTLRLHEMLAPGGVLTANLIDDFNRGRFLGSYVRTLQSVFGDEHVIVVLEGEEDKEATRSTFIVAASTSRLTFEDGAYILQGAELRRWLAARDTIILTDDYAPVDNMLAPLFRERFVDELQGE